MRIAAFGLTAAALLSASAAEAADLTRGAPAPNLISAAPVSDWQGFYAGSLFGVGLGTFRSSQAASKTITKLGQTGGALLGYSFQSGPFVYGVEGDITLHVLRGRNPGVAPGLVASTVDSLYTSRIRARLGYDLGQFLPFVAGGVAFTESYQYDSPLEQFGQTHKETGLTLGAGLDWRFVAPFLGPVTLRGEYVYDAYPEDTFALSAGPIRTRISSQFFRIGLIARPGDMHPPAASDVAPADWSGAYAGLIGGGLWTQSRTSLAGATTSLSASGPSFGVYSGRNFMFGSWMLGFEGSTALTNATGTGPQPLAPTTTFRNYVEADMRGRAGYAIGRFLPYVAAGAGWGRSEQIDLGTGSERGRVPSESITLGAGVDYMLSENWSARAEYLYDTSFKNADTRLDGLAYSQSRTAQQVRLGVAYHFH